MGPPTPLLLKVGGIPCWIGDRAIVQLWCPSNLLVADARARKDVLRRLRCDAQIYDAEGEAKDRKLAGTRSKLWWVCQAHSRFWAL